MYFSFIQHVNKNFFDYKKVELILLAENSAVGINCDKAKNHSFTVSRITNTFFSAVRKLSRAGVYGKCVLY